MGFALIIILVAVILLIFLGLSFNKNKQVEIKSYEVESFLSTVMQYTSDCKTNIEFLSIQKLMFSCYDKQECENGKKACELLNKEITEIMKEAWPIVNSPMKAYEFDILANNQTLINPIKQGNSTLNFKGTTNFFSRSGVQYTINVKIYS